MSYFNDLKPSREEESEEEMEKAVFGGQS